MACLRQKKKNLRKRIRELQNQADSLTRAAPEPETREKNRQTRELNGQIRAVEDDGRRFVLSFSSEEPYERWFGPEILDHKDGAMDMSRLTDIGVVLYNHNRDAVIGKVTRCWIEDNRGQAEIEFDSDELSETIYQKVKSGTLKGVSVGYMVTEWEEVTPGRMSSDNRFKGPCSIARRWTPYEISIVSIPADATVGVGRELDAEEHQSTDLLMDTLLRQLQYNQNLQEV